MSRALNLDASEDNVTATCAKHSVRISMIEPLAGGGTRIVLFNSQDAALIAGAFGGKVMTGAVERVPLRPRR